MDTVNESRDSAEPISHLCVPIPQPLIIWDRESSARVASAVSPTWMEMVGWLAQGEPYDGLELIFVPHFFGPRDI